MVWCEICRRRSFGKSHFNRPPIWSGHQHCTNRFWRSSAASGRSTFRTSARPSPLSLTQCLGRHGGVLTIYRIAPHLTADRRTVSLQFPGNLRIRIARNVHLGYTFSFTQRNLVGHRCDSVRRDVRIGSTSRSPSGVFNNSNLSAGAFQIRWCASFEACANWCPESWAPYLGRDLPADPSDEAFRSARRSCECCCHFQKDDSRSENICPSPSSERTFSIND